MQLQAAKKKKADAYITADLKYHDFFEGNNDFLLIDAGHYETEQHTKKLIHDYLTEKIPSFAILLSDVGYKSNKLYVGMAKKTEISVEERLRALYDLQLIDAQIDKIRNIRGELPIEVEDLEDEVAGLGKRVENTNTEIKAYNDEIKVKKNAIETSKGLIKKYGEQQENVRNNRAFESLNKEIEYQELEIQLAEKQINQLKELIEKKNEELAQAEEKLSERENHLKHKKEELDAILAETQKEEDLLLKKSAEFEKKVEERLVTAYKRIRSSVRNGLAVVPIERGASAGSFFTIPPQVQLEIASRKKIITDEHSGRILVDAELAQEEQEKMQALFTS